MAWDPLKVAQNHANVFSYSKEDNLYKSRVVTDTLKLLLSSLLRWQRNCWNISIYIDKLFRDVLSSTHSVNGKNAKVWKLSPGHVGGCFGWSCSLDIIFTGETTLQITHLRTKAKRIRGFHKGIPVWLFTGDPNQIVEIWDSSTFIKSKPLEFLLARLIVWTHRISREWCCLIEATGT